MTESYQLNDGHILEAVDRVHVGINYLQSFLAEHALIHAVNEYEADVLAAIEILSDLYQKIGLEESVAEIAQQYALRSGYSVVKR